MRTLSLVCLLILAIFSANAAILNPSFESDAGDGSAQDWSDANSAFGFSRCTLIDCGDGGGSAGARTGDAWIWFGGSADEITASLHQSSLIIPTTASSLYFYLWIGLADSPATLSFSIDGNQLFSVTGQDMAAYSSYTLVDVPLGVYADGAAHTVRFDFVKEAGDNANFSLDDISIAETGAPIPEPATVTLSALGLGLVLLRRFRR